MQITTNFHMSELIRSTTAAKRGINNEPTERHKNNLIESTKNLFQPTRDALGHPVVISSGYRSGALNKSVGGSDTSAHSEGFAIDFTCPGYGDTRKTAEFLVKYYKEKGIKYDQLILEFPDSSGSWIHLGYKNNAGKQRQQVLTAKRINGKTKYFQGLK